MCILVIIVKKGDPPLELPSLPSIQIPSSASEAWTTIKSFGKTKSSVTDEQDVVEEKVKDACGVKKGLDDIITRNEGNPANAISNLHEQCHCSDDELLHDSPNPIPGV